MECLERHGAGPTSAWTGIAAVLLWLVDVIGMGLVSALLIAGFWLIWAFTRWGRPGGIWQQVDQGFVDSNEHLIRAFQAIAFIPLFLLTLAHFYGASSFVTGFSYLVDFVRPALTVLGMMSVGFLFGGLFGLPSRTIASPPGGKVNSGVMFGDRLETIADWFTKLLIGAGLTQLTQIARHYDAINDFFAGATGMQVHQPLGLVLALAALAAGFLLGYVSALLFMPIALHSGFQHLVRAQQRATAEAPPSADVDPGDEEDHPPDVDDTDDPGDEEDHAPDETSVEDDSSTPSQSSDGGASQVT
jgi:hypothetical protein